MGYNDGMSAGTTATTITDKNGTIHRITTDVLEGAIERGEKYLNEAVRRCAETASHMNSGGSPDDLDYTRHDQWVKRNKMTDVWFPLEHSLDEDDKEVVFDLLQDWINGELEDFKWKFAFLNDDLDVDHTYLLFGIPIRQLPVSSQEKLQRLGAQFADRNLVTTAEDDDD